MGQNSLHSNHFILLSHCNGVCNKNLFSIFILFGVISLKTMSEENEVLFKKETKSLVGKIFIVTGANRGFGYAITETLAERHATVVMACRDSVKAYEAISKIRLKTATGSLVQFHLYLFYPMN